MVVCSFKYLYKNDGKEYLKPEFIWLGKVTELLDEKVNAAKGTLRGYRLGHFNDIFKKSME